MSKDAIIRQQNVACLKDVIIRQHNVACLRMLLSANKTLHV